MPAIARSGVTRILSKLILIAICALCLQALCSCAVKPGDEGAIEQVIKYANSRVMLDLTSSSVIMQTPDAQIEFSVVGLEDTPEGREIKIDPAVVSDTMASWGADEWAENRSDLFFNLASHFSVVCRQAHELSNVPEDYVVTCPDYMVVYDSQRNTGFIVSSTGVYQKTDDPKNPVGDAIVVTAQSR